MKIEVLYPEIANLFGDLANVKYLRASVPECEVVNTDLNSVPAFIKDGDVDLVYMGTMTENSQLIAMEHLKPYMKDIRSAVEGGQRFLFTGNAFEIFCREIVDSDDIPTNVVTDRTNAAQKTTECLGLFDLTVRRAVMHRFNSLYLGKYGELDIVGFKSVFTYAEAATDSNSAPNTEAAPDVNGAPSTDEAPDSNAAPNTEAAPGANAAPNTGAASDAGDKSEDAAPIPFGELSPLFETVKGPGLDRSPAGEGIRYGNFMATYLTGPLLLLNPLFTVELLREIGETEINPPYMDAAMEAYDQRLSEFRRNDLKYEY